MFKTELEYFIANQDSLVRQYHGKTLVLREQSVVGVYDTPLNAYREALKQYELGTFMIQRCEPGPEAYTVTVATRGIFS